MQAVILAAGIGERLGDITQNIPKPMIRINGKPILEHNIMLCKNNGIDEILINLHHLPLIIKNYFGNGEKWGVKIDYRYEPKLLGTAGTIRNFQDVLVAPFFVIYGDNYYNYDTDLNAIRKFHEKNNSEFTLGLCEVEDVSQSGYVEQKNDNRITFFIEKPAFNEVKSGWVNAGIYFSEPKILKKIKNGNTDFGRDIIPLLINSSYNVFGFKLNHKVIAIDTPSLFEKQLSEEK